MKGIKSVLTIVTLSWGLFFPGSYLPEPAHGMDQQFAGSRLIKVVDTNTPIPGSHELFTNIGYPELDGRRVAFSPFDPSGRLATGVYLFTGGKIVTIADLNTDIPGSQDKFADFDYVSLSGGDAVFAALDPATSEPTGIYLYNGRKIVAIADLNTDIPGSQEKFTGFRAISMSGGKTVFAAEDSATGEPAGIYLQNGKKIVAIADRNTFVPGSQDKFTWFDFVQSDNGKVFFLGGSGASFGAYLHNGRKLVTVVDSNTIVPGTNEPFAGLIFYGHNISGKNVVFMGGSAAAYGVYLFNGNRLTRVADTNTDIPGSAGKFTGFDAPVISGGNVAFLGEEGSAGRWTGIYHFNGKRLRVIADGNTFIPESQEKFSAFGRVVISGRNVAFTSIDYATRKRTGIYLHKDSKLLKVADANTDIPGSQDMFGSMGSPVISGGRVAFWGQDAPESLEGIYLFEEVHSSGR